MKIFAFIFARGGSKGLKNKNLKVFDGETLVGRTINQAKKSKLFKKVILSSDSNKILTEGKKKTFLQLRGQIGLQQANHPKCMHGFMQ